MSLVFYLVANSTYANKLFGAAITNQTLSHAYLLHGLHNDSLIKESLAIIQLYLTTHHPIHHHSPISIDTEHPDILIINQKEKIKRSDIESVIDRIKYGPSCYSHCFICITQIENMTLKAANMFLKTLEEPLPGICFMLTTTRRADVLPTIASRCHCVYIPSTATLIPSPILCEWDTFAAYTHADRLELIKDMATDKENTILHLYYWLNSLHTLPQTPSHTTVTSCIMTLLESLSRPVNLRLQLETLALWDI